MYIHAIMVDEKRGHAFEGVSAEAYGRAWGEEKEGGMLLIKIQSQNRQK